MVGRYQFVNFNPSDNGRLINLLRVNQIDLSRRVVTLEIRAL